MKERNFLLVSSFIPVKLGVRKSHLLLCKGVVPVLEQAFASMFSSDIHVHKADKR